MSLFLFIALPTGVFPWTLCITSCMIATALVVSRLADPHRGALLLDPCIQCVLLFIIVFLAIYLLPLPLRVTAITPLRYEQNQRAFKTIEQAHKLGIIEHPPSIWFALTRNKAGTVRQILSALTAIGAFCVVAGFSRRGKDNWLRFLCAVGCLVAVGGCLGQWWFPQGDTLWWVIPVRHALPGPIAFFRSRNHYAAFLAVISPVTIGLMLASIQERKRLRAVIMISLTLFLGAAVMLSLSRGGLLSFAAGLVAWLAVALLRRRKSAVLPLLLVSVLLAWGVAAAPHEAVRERMDTFRSLPETDSYVTRLNAWRDSFLIWKSYPVLGTGPNGFRMTYPQYRQTSRSAFMTHPENEYVQLVTDHGMLGVFLAVLAAAVFSRRAVRPAFSAVDTSPFQQAGAVALVVAAVNSFVDFPLHSHIYLTVFASLAALLVDHKPVEVLPASWHKPAIELQRWTPIAFLLLAVTVSSLYAHLQRLDSSWHLYHYDIDKVAKSVLWAPTSSYSWYRLGREAAKIDDRASRQFAEYCVMQSVRYDPNNYKRWKGLGMLQLKNGSPSEARESFAKVKELRSWVPVPDIPEESK
ncbi:MAG: O-antigen ligase family protein [Kiritimatiellia bacterium]|nr:O-antigen ligase family protein [Kiritimatiellia bacterium]